MEVYLVYHSSDLTGYAIIGVYCNYKAAIRSAMRKVYQLLDIKAKKIEKEWTWIDGNSSISVVPLPLVDYKDTSGDSPIPQFLRYKEYLDEMPVSELESRRMQVLNRKKLVEKIKKLNNK